MNVFTAEELRALDAYTIANESISSTDLMERAAAALAEEIHRIVKADSHFVVFAGAGNNGGDALAVARLLYRKGHRVSAYLINIGGKLAPDCEANKKRLVENCPSVEFHEITAQFDMPALTAQDYVIDGLFGTGLNKPLTGGFAMLVKFINRSEATIISLDIPSGLMPEDNTDNYRANIIRADYTFTLQAIKPSFLMTDNQPFLGRWKVLDIRLMENECPLPDRHFFLNDRASVRPLLKTRNPFGNKGTFGHGLLIAGSYGMAGAAILCARACLRSGIGKLTVHTPKGSSQAMQIAIPEAVLHHDDDAYAFTTPVKMDAYNALAIGPGLGLKNTTANAFIQQIVHTQKPMVIDADGLNVFADHRSWVAQIPAGCILTPHPKEFERTFGESLSDYARLRQAISEAKHLGVYIVLKGHYTAIVCPDGDVYFNTETGNSGMATAGSGDVLTGVLLSLLAQGYNPKDACRLGVYLHALAGDFAADDLGEEGVMASDIIHYLPYAFRQLRKSL